MSNSWKIERLKYCRIERVDGELKYYVMNGDEPVEVTKDVYLVIEHSYHKEWLMEHGQNSDWLSLEQIAEDEETIDRHGHVPPALQIPSAEDTYFSSEFRSDDQKRRQRMIKAAKTQIDQLEDEQKALVLSHVVDNGAIESLAKKDHVTTRAVYLRRDTVCRRIARKVKEDAGNE